MLYDEIVFDHTQNVEVIPRNLLKFDMYILLTNSGYYNERLHSTENIYPTIKKMYENWDIRKDHKFNRHLKIFLGSCRILPEDFAKEFASSVGNEFGTNSYPTKAIFKTSTTIPTFLFLKY